MTSFDLSQITFERHAAKDETISQVYHILLNGKAVCRLSCNMLSLSSEKAHNMVLAIVAGCVPSKKAATAEVEERLKHVQERLDAGEMLQVNPQYSRNGGESAIDQIGKDQVALFAPEPLFQKAQGILGPLRGPTLEARKFDPKEFEELLKKLASFKGRSEDGDSARVRLRPVDPNMGDYSGVRLTPQGALIDVDPLGGHPISSEDE